MTEWSEKKKKNVPTNLMRYFFRFHFGSMFISFSNSCIFLGTISTSNGHGHAKCVLQSINVCFWLCSKRCPYLRVRLANEKRWKIKTIIKRFFFLSRLILLLSFRYIFVCQNYCVASINILYCRRCRVSCIMWLMMGSLTAVVIKYK